MIKISIKMPSGHLETQKFHSSTVTIGRSPKCDFVVPLESLSRQHCLIELENGEFFITDLGSSNGVFLDGDQVPPHTRTHFTTFLQLSIGGLDTQVQDSEDHTAQKIVPSFKRSPSETPAIGTKNTATTKDTQTPANITKEIKVTKKKKESSQMFPVIAVGVILLGGAIYYQFVMKVDTPKEQVSIEKNVPVKFGQVKDEFLTSNEYMAIEADKNCTSIPDVCEEMKLTVDNFEGAVLKNDEVFVYVKENAHLKLPGLEKGLAKLPEAEANQLSSLYNLFNTKLFERFQKKEIAQIHLLLKNNEFTNVKVYRFHTKYYAGPERNKLFSEIGNALSKSSVATFWKYAEPIIKSKNL